MSLFKLRVQSLVVALCALPADSEFSLSERQRPAPKTHPNLGLPGPPVEVALGPVAIGLAVVAFQAMLLGGLGGTSA